MAVDDFSLGDSLLARRCAGVRLMTGGSSWRLDARSCATSNALSGRDRAELAAAAAVYDGIDAMLRADLDAPRKQRHTARRVLARLVDEHGAADLSYSAGPMATLPVAAIGRWFPRFPGARRPARLVC
jgi:hypothetical protein